MRKRQKSENNQNLQNCKWLEIFESVWMNNLNFVPFQNAKKEKIKSQFEHEVRTWLDKRGRHYIIVTGCQFRGDCSERRGYLQYLEPSQSV